MLGSPLRTMTSLAPELDQFSRIPHDFPHADRLLVTTRMRVPLLHLYGYLVMLVFDYLIKTPVPGRRNSLSSCWSGKYKRLPKQHMLLSLLLVASQMSTLLMTSQISDTGHRGSELDLASKPPHGCLAFIELEDSMYATNVEQQPIVLSCCEVYELQKQNFCFHLSFFQESLD